MTIDHDRLLALDIPAVEQRYAQNDAILYALAVGLGQDPVDPDELAFVYEKALRVLPTFALTLGYPGFWMRDLDTGVDTTKLLLGEQELVLHRPLAPRGHVVGKTRVTGIVDKGAGKGALVYTERNIVDASTLDRIATVRQTTFCRGDGGFGGPSRPGPAPHPLPERLPDHICDLATRPEAALIYRLASHDPNPLHVDPDMARAAGFPRPILHGLATFGVACHGLVKMLCAGEPHRLTAMAGRFSAPVFPGETIRTEIWHEGPEVSFRARVVERDVAAISHGRARCEPH